MIAIVGSGPTGIYTLAGLVQSTQPLRIVVFEKGEKAGIGMPYSPDTSSSSMLANIASIEIPPIRQSYVDWLRAHSDDQLAGYWLSRDEIHDRLFTPRLLLGEYFRDQLLQLAGSARARGHRVDFREATEVTDIVSDGRGITVHTATARPEPFDNVVLATGHEFPSSDRSEDGYFTNPWSGLIDTPIGEVDVGVLGTSLSGIDTVMAVALQHGAFRRCADGALTFLTTARDLSVTMMSRNGLLPEADFYCPIPYAPLQVLTEDMVSAFADGQCLGDGGLDRIYALFAQELALADPGYAERIGLGASSADNFADRYFAERKAHDPFDWARRNLEEVALNATRKITVAWRYAILRMHEKFQEMLPVLTDDDRDRFDTGLRRVFIDNYAAVPPESIRRLLALHEAGILSVAALGGDYDLTIDDGRTAVSDGDQSYEFDVFIDARGQPALTSADLPFPTLCRALIDAGEVYPQIDEHYHLVAPPAIAGRIAFGAIPYLMHDRPFVQGITESHEIGSAIAHGILSDPEASLGRVRRRWA